MRYRTLGRTGLCVSEIGVGCAPLGMSNYIASWDARSPDTEKKVDDLIHEAVDRGYNYFDTAPAYGGGRSEDLLGHALRGIRQKVHIATKLGRGVNDLTYNRGAWSPPAIRRSVEASLSRLGVDAIDVIQFHGGTYADGSDEVILDQGGLDACEKLRDEGKIRFIGFTTENTTSAAERLIRSGRFDTIQVDYHLMNTGASDFEKGHGIVRVADAQGMGIVVMRPLTGGVFMRLMSRYFPELDPNRIGEMLLNYVLSDPFVDCALVGTRRPARLVSNDVISDDVASRIDLEDLHQYFLARRSQSGD